MKAGPVHFIYLGGPWCWQYDRAITTARDTHAAPVWLWMADYLSRPAVDGVEVRPLEVSNFLREHPIQLANVKDLFAWRILYDHGGLYLDLDTISLRPVWDLLTRDVLVSYEHDDTYRDDHPYNSAVVAARPASRIVLSMEAAAFSHLVRGETQWGACGPRLLTTFVSANPDSFDVAPYGVLNGWRDGNIREYYAGARPGPDVRVVHLFSSSNMDAFHADRWMP
jgi:hypothetical protein